MPHRTCSWSYATNLCNQWQGAFAKSNLAFVVWRLSDFQFVLMWDMVIKAVSYPRQKRIITVLALIDIFSRRSCQVWLCSFTGTFALASGVVGSVQHCICRQALSSWRFIDIISFTFASGAIASVQFTEVFHVPAPRRFNRVVYFHPRVRCSCVGAMNVVRHAPSSW